MSIKYAMFADKAGFYDSGQDVYEKSDNGAWICSELRQVQSRIPSASGHAFCIQSSSGISCITVCKTLRILLSSILISQHCVSYLQLGQWQPTIGNILTIFIIDQADFLILVCFLQFAGGLDAETLCAFEEIRQHVPGHLAGSRELLAGIASS